MTCSNSSADTIVHDDSEGVRSRDCAFTNAIARVTLAIIWMYQGLIPKVLFIETSGEIETMTATGASESFVRPAIYISGSLEAIFGILMLVLWGMRSFYLVNAFLLVALTATVVVIRAEMYIWQFNPTTLNLAMLALSLIGWHSTRHSPQNSTARSQASINS